jgi:hypothetical protein
MFDLGDPKLSIRPRRSPIILFTDAEHTAIWDLEMLRSWRLSDVHDQGRQLAETSLYIAK